jgi:hypothetical protein
MSNDTRPVTLVLRGEETGMRRGALAAIWIAAVLLGGCSFPGARPPATTQSPPGNPTAEPGAGTQPTFSVETETSNQEATPAATTAPPGGDRPAEAILILQPGPASHLISPIHVQGIADPTFEQTLVVRLVLIDGTEVASLPATIAADVGQRGPFEADLPFNVPGGGIAFIQVYSQSPRDGGVTHLASVGVTLISSGPATVVPMKAHPEDIAIAQPQSAQSISGGILHVEGIALASFEQTLLIELYDFDGNVVASQPVIVTAPDLGQPGPFVADLPYSVAASGPARVVVRDVSPAYGGDVHLASVDVDLNP